MSVAKKKRLVVAITGASGAIYGIRLLQVLQDTDIETHLIMSKAAHITIAQETEASLQEVKKLADKHYSYDDIAACISSGSYHTMGMIVMPCSMKSLAEIATGITPNLLSRAADVILKERRRLVLCVRETPLNLVHIRNIATITEMGGIIAPSMPAFYPNPKSIDEIINHSVGRVLDLFQIETPFVKRWKGLKK